MARSTPDDATFNGVRRFDDLCAHLDVPRASLARRLRELTDAGLFEQDPYRDVGSGLRHEYRPTEMAWGLYPVLVGLMQWGDTYLNDGRPPLQLVDRATGQPAKAAVVTGDADELTPPNQMKRPRALVTHRRRPPGSDRTTVNTASSAIPNGVERRAELTEFLRTRRARLRPEEVGLPPFGGDRRRVPDYVARNLRSSSA